MALRALMPVVTEAVKISTCLSPNHGYQVVPEDQLAGGVVLWGDHIDGLVGIDGDKAGPVQLLGQVGADNLGAVQAEDGVHNGAGHIMLRQSLGTSSASLGGSQVVMSR